MPNAGATTVELRRSQAVHERAGFQYDQERDLYICPGGEELATSGTAHDGTTVKYLAKRRDSARCPLTPSCTEGPERRLARDVDEPVRDYVRAVAGTEAFKHSRDERKKVETAFAHMKRIFKLDRLRLRGSNGARDDILLAATAQNLRKLARYVAKAATDPKSRLMSCENHKSQTERYQSRIGISRKREYTMSALSRSGHRKAAESEFCNSIGGRADAIGTKADIGARMSPVGGKDAMRLKDADIGGRA